MQLRHEYKIELNRMDYMLLRQRLRAVLPHDEHADSNGEYRIRSLYFDNYRDKALREKLDGVNYREKFRIRCYNLDFSSITLEKKVKFGGLGDKLSAPLSRGETESLLRGELRWMAGSGEELIVELYSRMNSELLRPKVLVDYIREPFVYPAGNVRITLDRDIRTSLCGTDFFRTDTPMIPAGEIFALLEVKYDAFLPGFIEDAVQMGDRRIGAFSKYAACRMYD